MMKWVRRIVVALVVAFVVLYFGDWAVYKMRGSPQGAVSGEPDTGGSIEGQQVGIRLPGNERCSLRCLDFFAGRQKSLLATATQSQSEHESLSGSSTRSVLPFATTHRFVHFSHAFVMRVTFFIRRMRTIEKSCSPEQMDDSYVQPNTERKRNLQYALPLLLADGRHRRSRRKKIWNGSSRTTCARRGRSRSFLRQRVRNRDSRTAATRQCCYLSVGAPDGAMVRLPAWPARLKSSCRVPGQPSG